MDVWIEIVVRQITLYLLPVMVSLTLVCLAESKLRKIEVPHPFFSIAWQGAWLPLLASIAFTRGIIFALPKPLKHDFQSAFIRFLTHLCLTVVGFLLYAWSLSHQAPIGLPPLHHWWAKVLMFFNLCMLGIHLLPLPNLLCGEWLKRKSAWFRYITEYLSPKHHTWLIALLAASPCIDWLLGSIFIYPIYEELASLAHSF